LPSESQSALLGKTLIKRKSPIASSWPMGISIKTNWKPHKLGLSKQKPKPSQRRTLMISPCHSGNHTTAKISKGQLQFEDLPLVFRPAFLIRLRLLFIPRKRGQKTKRGAQEIRRLNLLSSNHVICLFRHFFIYHLHLLYINVFTVYSSKFSFLSFVFTMVFFPF